MSSSVIEGALNGLTGERLRLECRLGDGPDAAKAMLSEEQLLARLKDEFGAEELIDDPIPTDQD
jgi:hypothetical protein